MSLSYKKFFYYYPPRPELSISPQNLGRYFQDTWMGEAKLNGSNATVYVNGNEKYVYDRHKKRKDWKINTDLFPKDGWWAFNGEWMNKGQTDTTGKRFNHKFVIFDILVADNKYLIGTTFEERMGMLRDLFRPAWLHDPYLYVLDDNTYLVKPLTGDFFDRFDALSKVKMYEGIVLKKRSGRMESGLRKSNTADEQIKFRKSTKNYSY